jgi:UDP-glucose 4-epimerase
LIKIIEELTGKEMDYTFEQRRPGDQLIYVTDFSKFSRHTGWEPRSNVRQTVVRIYDWWKNNREIFQPAAAAARSAVTVGVQLPRTA